MKALQQTIVCLLLSASLNHATEIPEPLGSFSFALSDGDSFPVASTATIRKDGHGGLILEVTERYNNSWQIPIVFRMLKDNGGNGSTFAFNGNFETKDKNDGNGTFLIRISGIVLADGSLQGVWIRLQEPGYQSAPHALASVDRFTMKPNGTKQ